MKAWDAERWGDLMRQGFMKPRRSAPVKRPIVSCEACMNWHLEGKHTADAATRKANRAAKRSP